MLDFSCSRVKERRVDEVCNYNGKWKKEKRKVSECNVSSNMNRTQTQNVTPCKWEGERSNVARIANFDEAKLLSKRNGGY